MKAKDKTMSARSRTMSPDTAQAVLEVTEGRGGGIVSYLEKTDQGRVRGVGKKNRGGPPKSDSEKEEKTVLTPNEEENDGKPQLESQKRTRGRGILCTRA